MEDRAWRSAASATSTRSAGLAQLHGKRGIATAEIEGSLVAAHLGAQEGPQRNSVELGGFGGAPSPAR